MDMVTVPLVILVTAHNQRPLDIITATQLVSLVSILIDHLIGLIIAKACHVNVVFFLFALASVTFSFCK